MSSTIKKIDPLVESCMNFMIIYAVKLYLTGQASTTAMPLYVLSRLVFFT